MSTVYFGHESQSTDKGSCKRNYRLNTSRHRAIPVSRLTEQLLTVQLQDGEHKAKPPEMLGEKEYLQLEPWNLIFIKQYLVIVTITVSNLKGV